jgi:omega-amidase
MTSARPIRQFKFAAIQLRVTADKDQNLMRVRSVVREAAQSGARVVALPECFNSPYGNKYFATYAESVPDGATSRCLQEIASENKVLLIGGSIPERDGDKLYNTSVVYSESGALLAKFRKMHLFDVAIKGGITFQESLTLTAGDDFALFDSSFGRFGLGICYDVRFAPLAQLYAKQGAQFLVYPGAFNTVTGPLHWELLARARAVDNQLFVALVSPARDPDATYQAYGHSLVVDPWAKVLAQASHEPAIVYADIDLDRVDEVRAQIPVTSQQRTDVYDVAAKSKP